MCWDQIFCDFAPEFDMKKNLFPEGKSTTSEQEPLITL